MANDYFLFVFVKNNPVPVYMGSDKAAYNLALSAYPPGTRFMERYVYDQGRCLEVEQRTVRKDALFGIYVLTDTVKRHRIDRADKERLKAALLELGVFQDGFHPNNPTGLIQVSEAGES